MMRMGMSTWISVKDKLPDLGIECIITNKKHTDIGYRTVKGWYGHMLNWNFPTDAITEEFWEAPTHWMPLPEPPNDQD